MNINPGDGLRSDAQSLPKPEAINQLNNENVNFVNVKNANNQSHSVLFINKPLIKTPPVETIINNENNIEENLNDNKPKEIPERRIRRRFRGRKKKTVDDSAIKKTEKGEKVLMCTCTKTECRKKYCACYSKKSCCGKFCTCENCKNRKSEDSPANSAVKSSLPNEIVICNCTKSNCCKKYCECYKVGRECTWLCRCVGCENCTLRRQKFHNFEIEGITFEISGNEVNFYRRRKGEIFDLNCFDCETNLHRKQEEFYTPMKVLNRKTRREKVQTTAVATTTSRASESAAKKKSAEKPKKKLPKRKLDI